MQALLLLAMAACAGPSPPPAEPPPTPVVSASTSSSSPVSAALPPRSAAPLLSVSAMSSASAEPPAIALKLPHCEELAKVYCSSAFRSFDGGNKCGEIKKALAVVEEARDPAAAAALDERCKRSYPSAIGAIKR